MVVGHQELTHPSIIWISECLVGKNWTSYPDEDVLPLIRTAPSVTEAFLFNTPRSPEQGEDSSGTV